jgi:hypothetical protein
VPHNRAALLFFCHRQIENGKGNGLAYKLAVVLDGVLVGLNHLLKNETHTNFEF